MGDLVGYIELKVGSIMGSLKACRDEARLGRKFVGNA